jgi:hypothetical protein
MGERLMLAEIASLASTVLVFIGLWDQYVRPLHFSPLLGAAMMAGTVGLSLKPERGPSPMTTSWAAR